MTLVNSDLTWLRRGYIEGSKNPLLPQNVWNVPLLELLQNDQGICERIVNNLATILDGHNHDSIYYRKNELRSTTPQDLIHRNKIFPTASNKQTILLMDQPIEFSLSGTPKFLEGGQDGFIFTDYYDVDLSNIIVNGNSVSIPSGSGVIISAYGMTTNGFTNAFALPEGIWDIYYSPSLSPTAQWPPPVNYLISAGGEEGKYGTNGKNIAGHGILQGKSVLYVSAGFTNCTVWGVVVNEDIF